MEIIEKTYKWAKPLYRRTGKPEGVTLHHTASSTATADQIHQWHLDKGWSGIEYNALVRKNGKIYRGRPLWALTGHALGCSRKLGIVFEGNFENERMGAKQILAGKWLLLRWRKKYGLKKSSVHGHGSEPGNSTACPGKNFPFAKIVG